MAAIQEHPWGFTAGPTDAQASLAVVGGQHAEFEGQMVATRWAELVARLVAFGSKALLRDPDGVLIRIDVSFLTSIRLLVATGLNQPGLASGCRWLVDSRAWAALERPTLDAQVDLNRQWPTNHPVVRPVWEAISALPGRACVVDCHSHGSWPTKARPLTYAYVPGEGDHVTDPILSACLPDLPLRGTRTPGCLMIEARRAGHWACVLEMAQRSATTEFDGVQALLAIARHVALANPTSAGIMTP